MSLIKQVVIIDLIIAFWNAVIFISLFLWLPLKTSSCHSKPNAHNQIVGFWLRTMFITITGVLSLSYLHLLNWLTLALVYISYLIFNYLESYTWRIKDCQQILQEQIFNLIDVLDQGLSPQALIKNTYKNFQTIKQRLIDYVENLVIRQGMFFVAVLTIVLGFALLLRWEYPLLELRFSNSDRYEILLLTRQILAGTAPETPYLPVFPAFATVLSLLGSIDGMQVIRFLSPMVGMMMVLGVGYLVRVLTKNSFSALVAMLCLGVYCFTWEQTINSELPVWLTTIIHSLKSSLIRQWNGNELELGTIFLLFGLGYYFDKPQKNITFKINFICSIILIVISAPPLLILVLIAVISSIGGKKTILSAIALTWIVLAGFAAMTEIQLLWTQSFLLTLPVALSLLAGFLFTIVANIVKILSQRWAETFCLAIILSLSINFLLPLPPNLTYVEYDIAARKTLEIKTRFPSQTWTLVAPVEQLAEIYSYGWYQDLALFVEQYASQVAGTPPFNGSACADCISAVNQPEFRFPVSGKDLFILVEKIPFVTFTNEPSVVPDSILSERFAHLLRDRTYRYYRSSAGRSSLEYEAWQMCETYFHNHPDSQIYYEDRELKIYWFKV
ncbi:hypothetical protein Sta7437_2152 [Stanieria cyanosphaera PCC 7437]|uniref:Glycosyltransferase RgtA/B/C/D-like domain-containing protein n=1 Tax=Stanieria cyanosphaera (strain ATCC 29371 / PCC 7437) TaxID=111780 RepID=K9XUE5_STAC7|nr:hypothetical protein [Stanieria cyanosphaera]AFZ35701.1 hypothetical protein Sta7437_2152 [Stanieria cyanosphaera PCC 7437]